MNKTVRFSPCNPIRFVKEGLTQPSATAYPPYGQASYTHSLQPWKQPPVFVQKFCYDDVLCFQVHVQEGCTNAEPQLYDHNGTYLASIAASAQLVVPGNRAPNGAQLVTLQYYFTHAMIPALAGKDFVYLRLLTEWGPGAEDEYYRSEPIWFRREHAHTVLLAYSNAANEYDTIFEQVTPLFRLRVPSMGLRLQMGADYSSFENQVKELQKLSGKSYRNFVWEIGGQTGLPDYMADIIGHALHCDKLFIEGRGYQKEEGAVPEPSGEDNLALRFYNMVLREAIHSISYTHGQEDVLLWERPATGFPYALHQVHLSDGSLHVYSGTRLFEDAADENAFISEWQSKRWQWGLRGMFTTDGAGKFYYTQAEGEHYTAVPPAVYNKYFTLHTFIVYASVLLPFNFQYSFRGGSHVFAPDNAGVYPPQYHASEDGAFINHQYLVMGDTVVAPRIFHNDSMLNFQYAGVAGSNRVVGISGEAPASLQSWDMAYADFSALPSLSLEFLRPCAQQLRELLLRACGIKAVAAGWGNRQAAYANRPYDKLFNINLQSNPLTVPGVDAFINEVGQGIKYTQGGTLDLRTSGQSKPTFISQLSRALLASAVWTVLTD